MVLFNVIPLELLTDRLFNAVTLLGIFMLAELPPKTRLDDDVADKLVGVPAIAGPFSVNVCAPTVNVPFVSVSVPSTVTSPPMLIPLARLIMRLFNVTEGSVVEAPLPPKVILEEEPPVREPLVWLIAPFKVRVCAPIDRAPLVKVRVPLTISSAPKLTPLELLIVRLLNVVVEEPPID